VTASLRAPVALRTVLGGAIDYAGLFPPADLDMTTAVTNYDAYLRGPEAWALGSFVVTAARLAEFRDAASVLPSGAAAPWRLSVLVGSDAGLAPQLLGFNVENGDRWRIESVEARAGDVADVGPFVAYTGARLATYVEIAPSPLVDALLTSIRAIGARAKLRMGGVTPGAFPAARDVLRFMRSCRRIGVSFKATAGLHHPLRGDFRLTYRPDSPCATMFGYLNVFVAAALVVAGAEDEAVLAVLSADEAGALEVADTFLRVGHARVSCDAIAAMRTEFMMAFGSCSFREPLDDVARLLAT
jgi:hypothetical protein